MSSISKLSSDKVNGAVPEFIKSRNVRGAGPKFGDLKTKKPTSQDLLKSGESLPLATLR